MSQNRSKYNLKSTGTVTSQPPCNYEIFSLSRVLTVSTGSYANSSEEFIDTTQWSGITAQYAIDNDSELSQQDKNSVSGLSRVDSLSDLSDTMSPAFNTGKDDIFFTGALKGARHAPSQTMGITPKAQSLLGLHGRNNSTPSLLAYTHGSKFETARTIDVAVTFKQVISAGHRGLYHVIAALCTNDVILLRFTGIVKSIDRDDDTKRRDFDEDNPYSEGASDTLSTASETDYFDEQEENDEQSQLASPIVRCVNHFKEKKISIVYMTLDDSAKWLTCITANGEVYLVPVCRLFFPYNTENIWPFRKPEIPVRSVFVMKQPTTSFVSLKDYTTYITDFDRADKKKSFLMTVKDVESVITSDTMQRPYKFVKHGCFTCCTWWKTFEQKDFLLIGTDRGYVVILNMQSQIEEGVISGFKHPIRTLEVVEDLQRSSYKYLLVHTARGQYFRLNLEQEDTDFHSYRTISEHCRTNSDPKLFEPNRIDILAKGNPCRVNVNRTNSKKSNLLSCYSRANYQLSIYDPENQRYPLYVFQMNRDAGLVHMTDQLLFSVQRSNEAESERIWVTSRILASQMSTDTLPTSTMRNTSVFQEFILPAGQHALGFMPGFVYKKPHSRISPSPSITSLDEMETTEPVEPEYDIEGAYVWTQDNIYELKQKNTPPQLFHHMIENNNEQAADQFGKTFDLDLFRLYESSGDAAFEAGKFDKAFKLYGMSNIAHDKMAKCLMKAKRTDAALEYLDQVLATPENLSVAKRRDLADLMFLSYMLGITSGTLMNQTSFNVEQITNDTLRDSLRGVEQQTLDASDRYHHMLWQIGSFEEQHPPPCSKALWNRFRLFLAVNQDYNPTSVTAQLISRGFIGLAIEVAHSRGAEDHVLMNRCLYHIVQKGFIALNDRKMRFFFDHGYVNLVIRTGDGVLLRSVTPPLRVLYLLHYIKSLREKRVEKAAKSQYSDNQDDDLDIDSPPTQFQRNTPYYGYTPEVWKGRYGYFDDDDLRSFHLQLSPMLFELLPFIQDEDVLLDMAVFFFPEKTISESKEEYCYPYIHVQSHLELFICSLLEASRFSTHSKAVIGDKKVLSNQMQTKVEETIQKYADRKHSFRRNFLLTKCFKYGNKSAAAVIYETKSEWNDALCCRLSAIRESEGSPREVIALLDKYIVSRTDRSVEGDAKLLTKIFRFWETQKFPIEPLEEHLLRQMHSISESLSHLLLTWKTGCPPFTIGLSHKFYWKLSHTFVNSLKKFENDEHRSNRALQSQILRNMEKDLNERPHILNGSRDVGNSVVFSCGHTFERTMFFERIVPEFRRRMLQFGSLVSENPEASVEEQLNLNVIEPGKVSDYLTTIVAKTIASDYDLLHGAQVNQSCPACVHNYLTKSTSFDLWQLE